MIIKISKLHFSYPERLVLKGINLAIKAGEFVGITGPTGSGKTTLAYCLNGLIPQVVKGKFRGRVTIDGLETSKTKLATITKIVGLVFQDPDWQLFNLSVEEEVAFGLKNLKIKPVEDRVNQALAQVELTNFAKIEPHKLSQGQKQKLCIASVLALEPKIIILDEPVSQLDYRSSLNIYEILKKLNRSGITIIVIEHDTDILASYATQVALMDQGKIVSFGPKKTVLTQTKLLKQLGIKIPHTLK